MRLNKDDSAYYREVIDEYKRVHGLQTYELREVLEWAIRKRRLELPPDFEMDYHLERASQAQREDVVSDGNGARCRRRFAVTVTTTNPETGRSTQRHLWGDIDDAPDDFIQESIRQRIDGVRADFAAIKADVDFVASGRPRLGRRLRQMLLSFDPNEDGNADASAS